MSKQEISTLYRRYGPLLYSHLRKTQRDEAAVVEATQRAFQRLVSRARTLDDFTVVRFIHDELK